MERASLLRGTLNFQQQRVCGVRRSGLVRIRTHASRQTNLEGDKKQGSKLKSKLIETNKPGINWPLALTASVLPMLQAAVMNFCTAAEVLEVADNLESEVENVDMGAILVGDILLLLMAPIVIYVALKMMFWEEDGAQGKEKKEAPPMDPLLEAHIRSVVKSSPNTSHEFVSRLTDPELQNLAETVSEKIATAVRETKEMCDFNSSLQDLAVAHGGSTANYKWVDDVLQKSVEEVREDEMLVNQIRDRAAGLKTKELCQLMTRSIAERTALHELKHLGEELERHYHEKVKKAQ